MSQILKEYRVTYNKSGPHTLIINPDQLASAQTGTQADRVKLANLYFGRNGMKIPAGCKWDLFEFAFIKDATHGCTCDDDCPGCDQGYHRCGRGCKYDQKMRA